MSVAITPSDIRWRVVRDLRNGLGQLVGYIDGRLCMQALDNLDLHWSAHHTPYFSPEGRVVLVQCNLTVDGVTRSDAGVPSNQDPEKGAYSDALKRAAVHFGIGRELYELPQVYAPLKDKVPTAKPRFNEESGRWEIEKPGYIVYPLEEPDPRLDESMDAIKFIIKANPDKKGQATKFAKENNLDKGSVDDMARLLDHLDDKG